MQRSAAERPPLLLRRHHASEGLDGGSVLRERKPEGTGYPVCLRPGPVVSIILTQERLTPMFSGVDTRHDLTLEAQMFGPKQPLSGHDFTDDARAAVRAASSAAAAMGHSYVGTEHVLLTLAGMADSAAARMLAAVGVSADQIRAAIMEAVGTLPAREGDSVATIDLRQRQSGANRPLTKRAKRVLEIAMDEARQRGDSHVGTEHLLLALRVENGVAANVLDSLGVSLERLRAATGAHPGANSGAAPSRESGQGTSAMFRIAIDDTSNQSIYEQIVARIQEGIATGALRPGDRLPTVRQLADELDVAPGTVARAYAELERAGAVITEGARGTRVAKREDAAATASDRHAMLVGLLRPVAVAAFHLGATAEDVPAALVEAMRGIFPPAA